MNWPNDPATESQHASLKRLDRQLESPQTPEEAAQPSKFEGGGGHESPHRSVPEIKIGKRLAVLNGKEVEVFTLTLGAETIELLPLKNWGQLDVYKWRVRGKLPGTPAGLEITPDHIKLAGQVASPTEPDGCAKLERLFCEWLALERETLELAKQKAHPTALSGFQNPSTPEQQAMHFQVEVDKEGQVHVHCVQGKETLATIGLNVPGFQGLVNQGLMRKPRALKTGALHDWVELDGVLYSFEKGNNDAAKLSRTLNEAYVPASTLGHGKEVVVFANAASSTGFDIQFPAKVGGVQENRRRPLAEDALELLQDPEHCGLLQNRIVIKLTRPTVIFKQKTPDGGERYLDRCAENLVRVCSDHGEEKVIDLSQPVNYLRLNAVELTAVFNHPTINRHTKAAPTANEPIAAQKRNDGALAQAQASPVVPDASTGKTKPVGAVSEVTKPVTLEQAWRERPSVTGVTGSGYSGKAVAEVKPLPERKPFPNLWVKPILEQQPIRYDWFTCLVYGKIAARVGNSREGKLMENACWVISLSEVEEQADPGFKGIFLTEKGGFGFLSGGYMARFENGAVLIGTQESALKGADVRLVAVGMETARRFVFIVSHKYRSKFGVPEQRVAAELARLEARGAVVMSVKETLESNEPLEVIWTVPAEQANPADPQALESTKSSECPKLMTAG